MKTKARKERPLPETPLEAAEQVDILTKRYQQGVGTKIFVH